MAAKAYGYGRKSVLPESRYRTLGAAGIPSWLRNRIVPGGARAAGVPTRAMLPEGGQLPSAGNGGGLGNPRGVAALPPWLQNIISGAQEAVGGFQDTPLARSIQTLGPTIGRFLAGGAGGLAGAVYGGGAGIRARHPFLQVLQDMGYGFAEGGRGAREIAQQNIEERGSPWYGGGGGVGGGGRAQPTDLEKPRPTRQNPMLWWEQQMAEDALSGYYDALADLQFGGGGGGDDDNGGLGFPKFDKADPSFWLNQIRWII